MVVAAPRCSSRSVARASPPSARCRDQRRHAAAEEQRRDLAEGPEPLAARGRLQAGPDTQRPEGPERLPGAGRRARSGRCSGPVRAVRAGRPGGPGRNRHAADRVVNAARQPRANSGHDLGRTRTDRSVPGDLQPGRHGLHLPGDAGGPATGAPATVNRRSIPEASPPVSFFTTRSSAGVETDSRSTSPSSARRETPRWGAAHRAARALPSRRVRAPPGTCHSLWPPTSERG